MTHISIGDPDNLHNAIIYTRIYHCRNNGRSFARTISSKSDGSNKTGSSSKDDEKDAKEGKLNLGVAIPITSVSEKADKIDSSLDVIVAPKQPIKKVGEGPIAIAAPVAILKQV